MAVSFEEWISGADNVVVLAPTGPQRIVWDNVAEHLVSSKGSALGRKLKLLVSRISPDENQVVGCDSPPAVGDRTICRD